MFEFDPIRYGCWYVWIRSSFVGWKRRRKRKRSEMTFDLTMTKRQDRTSVDDLFFLISAAPPPHHQLFWPLWNVRSSVLCCVSARDLALTSCSRRIYMWEYVTRSIWLIFTRWKGDWISYHITDITDITDLDGFDCLRTPLAPFSNNLPIRLRYFG